MHEIFYYNNNILMDNIAPIIFKISHQNYSVRKQVDKDRQHIT